MWAGEGGADEVIEAKGLKQITDTGAIEALVDAVLAAIRPRWRTTATRNPDKQPKMLGFFVGQIMKQSQGKANPQQVNALLREKAGVDSAPSSGRPLPVAGPLVRTGPHTRCPSIKCHHWRRG